MIGIICFFIIVVLAKILTTVNTSGSVLQKVIDGILFANFWLLLLIVLILSLADIFGAFPFPFNLPSPLIRAFGSIFCIAFILSVFQWADGNFNTLLFPLFWLPSLILIPLIFLLILISGYLGIMRRFWWQSKQDAAGETDIVQLVSVEEKDRPVSGEKSWEEIGAEFRLMLFDIIHCFRQEIKKKK
jgi:hypothetical protein